MIREVVDRMVGAIRKAQDRLSTSPEVAEALLPASSLIRAFGVECRCLNLDRLIEVKRAAGRPKDLEALAELEAIREERSRP